MSKLLTLIIEDEQKLATIFAEAFGAAKFEIEIISDGEQALARLLEVTPQVVVLDLHLPQVSGREILQAIRKDPRLTKTRVILATADPIVAETLREKADLVLIKPVSFKQLRELALRLHSPSRAIK